MSRLYLLLIVCLIASCQDKELEQYYQDCEVNWIKAEGVYKFSCPYEVIPNQRVFSIGDTITFRSHFSDTIYDEASQRSYYMPGFPFRSLFTLWWIPEEGGDIKSGLRHIPWQLDSSIVDRNYVVNRELISDHVSFRYFGQTDPEVLGYFFEAKFVLDTVGFFLLQAEDLISRLDNPTVEIATYDFECKHPRQWVYEVYNRIIHEDYLDDYDAELLRILDEVYWGDYKAVSNVESLKILFRQEGSFAFEVR
jgi:hypothetical protein